MVKFSRWLQSQLAVVYYKILTDAIIFLFILYYKKLFVILN